MSEVVIALISMVGGLGVAYIVNVASKKVQFNKNKKQPKDRMEQMFDGYERLIKQKDYEDERKQKYIQTIEEELRLTEDRVKHLENALMATRTELNESRKENEQLRSMLTEMHEEYTLVKKNNQDNIDEMMK